MKRVLQLVIVMALVLIAVAPASAAGLEDAKPPRNTRLELVNKSGEPIYVELTGVGYNFDEDKFMWHGGSYWWLGHMEPPLDAVGDYINVPVAKNFDIPRDLYQIKIWYQQELDGVPVVVCKSNWVPVKYVDKAAYFSMEFNRKLVVPACDEVAKVLVGPKNDVFKWARWLLVVK